MQYAEASDPLSMIQNLTEEAAANAGITLAADAKAFLLGLIYHDRETLIADRVFSATFVPTATVFFLSILSEPVSPLERDENNLPIVTLHEILAAEMRWPYPWSKKRQYEAVMV